jgi:poly(hydroxyalkanoate) granule-associated protein
MATKKAQSTGAKAAQGAATAMQEVWLAGLGALAVAQREGRTQFENLVQQGVEVEARLRKLAESQIEQTTKTMMAAAQDMTDKAQTAWHDMQKLFTGQMDKVMGGLGALGTPDYRAFVKRVEDTMANVQSIAKWPIEGMPWSGRGAKAVAKRPAAARSGTKRKAAKKSAKKAAKKVAKKR